MGRKKHSCARCQVTDMETRARAAGHRSVRAWLFGLTKRVRRGKRRPGQWSDKARVRRARRLDAARGRTGTLWGIVSRGECRGTNRRVRRAMARDTLVFIGEMNGIAPLPNEPTKCFDARLDFELRRDVSASNESDAS